MRAVGRLLRLSLSASALADVAAGLLLGAGAWPGGLAPWLLLLASLCVYHGGMALNDWADRGPDSRNRPDRPIPSGAVAPGAALALGAALLALGPGLAAAAGLAPALGLAAVAALALAYDLGPRGPWSGPLLLAACRAGNLGVGIAAGSIARDLPLSSQPGLFAFPLAYGAYVFLVSRLGRFEDGEERLADGRRPRLLLRAAALLLLAPAAIALGGWASSDEARAGIDLPFPAGPALALAVGLLGALGLARTAARATLDEPARLVPVMGMALRRLLVFTSAAALSTGTGHGLWVGAAILAGYPVSHALRRVFPPS